MNETKRNILDVSLKLFLQKTFKEVTLKEIVDKSGVSKGAFYHYFESKEQLFQEVIEDFLSSVKNSHRELRMDSLEHFYHDYINFVTGYLGYLFPNLDYTAEPNGNFNFFTLIFDAEKLFPDFLGKILVFQQNELEMWKKVIRIAQETGEIRSILSEEVIAQMFFYTADGLGLQSIVMQRKTVQTKAAMLTLWDGFYELLKR